jgi:hypothetical protein
MIFLTKGGYIPVIAVGLTSDGLGGRRANLLRDGGLEKAKEAERVSSLHFC